MDPIRNPFVPGAGTPPPELAGRSEVLERARITLERSKLGIPAKSFMLVGLRGVGKTVLLNRIQNLADDIGYRTIYLEAHENKPLAALLIPPLRQLLLSLDRSERISEAVKRGLRILKGFATSVRISVGDLEFGLGIDPEPGYGDSGDLEADLPVVLSAVAQAAKDRGTALAIIIDELQYLPEIELSALIMAMHRLAQKQMPLVLIGAGLPQLVGLAGKSKSYAERLFDFPAIGPLTPQDARQALVMPAQKEGVEYEDGALDEIIQQTKGYPYFLQEWGYHVWNHAKDALITQGDASNATPIAIRNLDESFFRVRFDRLTPREKDYLFSMARLGPGPHRSGDIAVNMSKSVEQVAPLRNSLIKKGMIYSPAHGDTAFTVPLFDEYLTRLGNSAI